MVRRHEASHISPRREHGRTFVELLIVLGLIGIAMMVAIYFSFDWFGREDSRGAAYTIETFLNMARMEAISRNQVCRFVIDTSAKTLDVYDLVDPLSATDDIQLAHAELPAKVSVAAPSGT